MDLLQSMSRNELLQVIERISSIVGLDVVKSALQSNGPEVPIKTTTKTKEEASIFPTYQSKKKKKNEKRKFDASRFRKRHVALRMVYFGESYHGFASQQNAESTVENYVFNALLRTHLITSRETCDYSRCGRTDKGVSAMGQVINLVVRSIVPCTAVLDEGESIDDLGPGDTLEVTLPSGERKQFRELDYCSTLNRALPPEIRFLAWSVAPENFSSRFSALYRTYKYFFFKKNRNLEKMQLAANKLVGVHDFRNFCKIDAANVHNFTRHIFQCSIILADETQDKHDSHQVCYLQICGQAFLWHQVRCLAAVLFMVGEGTEDPSIVDYLLDVDHVPRKPHYDMAPELPLVLHESAFESIQFKYEPQAYSHIYHHIQELWEKASIRASLLRNLLEFLNCTVFTRKDVQDYLGEKQYTCLMQEIKPGPMISWRQVNQFSIRRKEHLPLRSRKTAKSYEEKLSHIDGRKRQLSTEPQESSKVTKKVNM